MLMPMMRLGVSDKTLQAIPRHLSLSTTRNSYVKSVAADASAAMQKLEQTGTPYAPQFG